MSSTTAIINRALARIGRQRITSLDDRTADADLIRELYPDIRQELIRAHPWNFATRRTVLSPDGLNPAHGFEYRLPMPSAKAPYGAWLRIRGMWTDVDHTDPAEYRLEANTVLARERILYALIIHDIEDPNRMDALFRAALSLKLAHELAVALNNSNTQTETIGREHEAALLRARSVDALDRGPPVPPEPDGWAGAHHGGRAA